MIVDEVDLTITGGTGGNGHSSFRREKFIARGGPDGGNGGHGGNIFFVGVSDLSALRQFRFKKHVKGNNGEPGMRKKMFGKDAEDLYVKIPIGTEITDLQTGEIFNIDTIGQEIKIVKGGRGGRGNYEFKSNENKAPTQYEPGRPGQTKEIKLSLHFIADVGLIGLPSAGKSSLLNALTRADVKVGDYPFTTLEANLGEMEGVIIADIPGLIEGAHEGKGLGIKFLKHIEKTKALIHCIDSTSAEPEQNYQTIRAELESFNSLLTQKNEVILLTKIDLVDKDTIKKIKKSLEKFNPNVMTCSVLDDKQVEQVKKFIHSL
jgi:GTP-binding protein